MSEELKSLYICEWAKIHKGLNNKQENIDSIVLNSKAWDFLADRIEDKYLKFSKKDILQIKGFVGVITTADGTQIEILPKISEETTKAAADDSRNVLTKMLKEVNKLPFVESTDAHLQIKNQPLFETLIGWFLDCVDKIVKQGIRRDYIRVEAQEKFLKGQLQLNKQLNEPPHKQHLFHIEYDIFSPNRPENRLIHSALIQVSKWSKDNHNQSRAKHFILLFDEVPLSKNYKDDFDNWSKSREMNYYQSVLPWLRFILNQQSPYTLKDKNKGISFLIPMEKLFEKYVAKILKKQLPQNLELTEQKPQKPLAYYKDKKMFTMKPDIVISDNKKPICILDTKWKLINQEDTLNKVKDSKKRISQSDMYQLFAYGKKYNVDKVVLIYPEWNHFDSKFSFKLDENLILDVVPFDIKNDNNIIDTLELTEQKIEV